MRKGKGTKYISKKLHGWQGVEGQPTVVREQARKEKDLIMFEFGCHYMR